MKPYDEDMTASAAWDFLSRATREGRSEDYKPRNTLSRRSGNLVTVYGVSHRIAYYRVFKHPSGAEYVRPLVGATEEKLFSLVRGG